MSGVPANSQPHSPSETFTAVFFLCTSQKTHENTVRGNSQLTCRHVEQQIALFCRAHPTFEWGSLSSSIVQTEALEDPLEISSGPSTLSSPWNVLRKKWREKIVAVGCAQARTWAGVESVHTLAPQTPPFYR